MAIYKYESLNAQRREIRLCTLRPGFFDEPVACALSVVSLDDKPEYESLSYAWGSPVFDRELFVQDSREGEVDESAAGSLSAPGLILRVTRSLYTAFRYLRRLDRTRVVCVSDFHFTAFWGRLLQLKTVLKDIDFVLALYDCSTALLYGRIVHESPHGH